MSLISFHYCVVLTTSLKYLPFWAHFGILDRAVSGWFSWLFIGCSKHLWGAAFFQYGSIDAKPSPASTYTMQATPCSRPNSAVCKPYFTSEVSQHNLVGKLFNGHRLYSTMYHSTHHKYPRQTKTRNSTRVESLHSLHSLPCKPYSSTFKV